MTRRKKGEADELTFSVYVCSVCACIVGRSGQKCSAQSILFMHQNWVQAGLQDKLKVIANPQTLDLRH
jgi:1-pyrroline-5-carboxylate dehydrogenase